jgi:hypothetical protein
MLHLPSAWISASRARPGFGTEGTFDNVRVVLDDQGYVTAALSSSHRARPVVQSVQRWERNTRTHPHRPLRSGCGRFSRGVD